MPDIDWNHGGFENGGTRAFLARARSGSLFWDWTPEFMWEARVSYRDLAGPNATQRATITIGTADFVSGRVTVTFTGGGLSSPVVVTEDAAVADDAEALGTALASAIDALAATTLAGVITGADVDITGDNIVNVDAVQGIARLTVEAVYTPAQQTTVTWGGTLVDGLYSVEIDDGETTVDVPNNRAAGSPANAAAMAVAFEAAAEALIASTLADILVSADDVGAVNTLVFEPGVVATVTATVTSNTTMTFGGTATDGDYAVRLQAASLPGGSLVITTTRAAGSPATNTDLADAFEADAEARALLAPLLVNADNTAGANTLTFFDAALVETTVVSAPAPGTLVVSDPTVVIDDATPAGPVVSVSYSSTVDLNALGHAFPDNVTRLTVALEVVTAFGANRTIAVGDAGDPDGLLGSTPVDLNATGRTLSVDADAQHVDQYEGTNGPGGRLVPTATIVLGSSNVPTQGVAFVQIDWAPHPSNTANQAA
jgi:hypothetical protein